MAAYGYFRADATANEKAHRSLATALAKKAHALGEPLATVVLGDGPGDPARLVSLLQRGDTLILPRLDHLGTSMSELAETVKAVCDRGVRLYALRAAGGEMDLVPEAGETFLRIMSLWRETERALRSRRSAETARSRKAMGLAYCNPPLGKRIVRRGGVARLEWDQRELRHIAEIARRAPVEGVAAVANDFWRRGIKDRRGRPWGKQQPRAFSLHRSPYQSFHRAVRWFHRMKWKGLLPTPYGTLAESLPEPKTYREKPRPKGWTPGGTARREQERAETKAKHRAERLARREKEKAER